MAVLFATLLFCCTNEQLEDQDSLEKKIRTIKAEVTSTIENDEHCVHTNLIAAQHYTAGSVTIDVEDDQLIVTFSTNEDWTLGTTHLSIGICDDDWIPLTGSGNPQIGQFEFTEPYSITPNQVVYIIPITDVGDNYCFAAHAEVEGPEGGETAWGEGTQFSGNSWAMYNEFSLSECTSGGNNVF